VIPISVEQQPTSDESVSTVSAVSESAESGRRFELRDINIDFPAGELTVITGPTASGKTALLMALMGEMTAVSNDQPTIANLPSEDGPKIYLPKHLSQYDVTTGKVVGTTAVFIDAGVVVGATDAGAATRVDVDGGGHVQLRGA